MAVSDEPAWGLVLSFDGLDFGTTPEHAFVHGCEFGQIYQRMLSGSDAEIEASVHSINGEAYRRAAAAEGWDIELAPSEVEGWSVMRLTKRRAAKLNPQGLRVVQ